MYGLFENISYDYDSDEKYIINQKYNILLCNI